MGPYPLSELPYPPSPTPYLRDVIYDCPLTFLIWQLASRRNNICELLRNYNSPVLLTVLQCQFQSVELIRVIKIKSNNAS